MRIGLEGDRVAVVGIAAYDRGVGATARRFERSPAMRRLWTSFVSRRTFPVVRRGARAYSGRHLFFVFTAVHDTT